MLKNYIGPLMYTCRSTVLSDYLDVKLVNLPIDTSAVHD
jgi:hypothetical protein